MSGLLGIEKFISPLFKIYCADLFTVTLAESMKKGVEKVKNSSKCSQKKHCGIGN